MMRGQAFIYWLSFIVHCLKVAAGVSPTYMGSLCLLEIGGFRDGFEAEKWEVFFMFEEDIVM